MILHNVRLGFATNSSSAHSLIFLSDAVDSDVEDFDFGWNNFMAASDGAKKGYVALQIISALREIVDHKTAALVAKGLLGDVATQAVKTGSIDHQSLYALPYNWNGNGLDYEFVKEFTEFMTRKDLVILGGNDNDEMPHPVADGSAFNLPIPMDEVSGDWVAKKDPQGFLTLYNRGSGSKIRFSFAEDGTRQARPDYSTTPELIDLKITNFCDKGCAYCYQKSSPFDKHGDWGKPDNYNPCKSGNMYSFLKALSDMKVFEVAIGGGEPTSHPRFADILEQFREHGIVPSFSTGTLKWMKENSKNRERIFKAMGTFAYTVAFPQDIIEFDSLVRVYKSENIWRRPVLHHVLGTAPNLESLLEKAHDLNRTIVLLGYKNIGRGSNFQPRDYGDWVDVIVGLREKDKCPNISIDTPLANEFRYELKAAGVHDLFVNRTEGAFSMYIDLVTGKAGPSSFCSDEELVDFDAYSYRVYDRFKEIFPFARERE